MRSPARIWIALVIALPLAIAAAWLVLSRTQRETLQIPEAAATPAVDLRAEERLEAVSSKSEPRQERTVAPPARASTEDLRSLQRQLRPRAQPTQPTAPDPGLPCTLLIRVLDAEGTPVTSPQRIWLRWGDSPQQQRWLFDIEPKDGEFTCAIADASGTVDVYSRSLGTAQAPYAHPSGGTSRVELRLGFLALIQGRVVHEGSGIEGALVTLIAENSPLPDPLTCIAARQPGLRCRSTRDQLVSGADGRFQMAVQLRGHYRLSAREPAHGACISNPFEIADPPEPVVCVLELAPASHLEVRSPANSAKGVGPFVTLKGDNGLNTSARIDERDGVAAFDCLPQGSYVVLRPNQSPHAVSDPPTHLELDGSPETVARLTLREPGAIALEIARDDTQGRIEADLYRLGCCARLVSKSLSDGGSTTVPAGDPGEHLLGVYSISSGGVRCTRVFRVNLALGRNELALRPIELGGLLIVGTDRSDFQDRLLARLEIEPDGQMFVPLQRGLKPKQDQPDLSEAKFTMGAALPLGTCDVVCIRDGQFEVLQSGVRIGDGAPTIVRLSAGSGAAR